MSSVPSFKKRKFQRKEEVVARDSSDEDDNASVSGSSSEDSEFEAVMKQYGSKSKKGAGKAPQSKKGRLRGMR